MMSRSPTPNPLLRSPWPSLVLVSIALLIAFVLRDSIARFPRGLLTDDAYFYAKIAGNLAREGRSSFDGIHVTDGYHLLWTYLLAAVSRLTALVTLDGGFQLSALIATYLTIAVWIALRFGRTLAQATVLFFISIVFKMLMETTLLALLLLVLSDELYWRSERERPRAWMLAPVAFLVPLVRIDALLMPLLLTVGALLARGDRRSGWWVGLASAVGGGVQLSANHAISGHWTSVAAQIKSAAPFAVGENLASNLTGLYWGGLISFGMFALAVGFAIVRARRAIAREKRWSAYAALTGATAFILPHLLFNNCMRYWYYVPSLYLIAQTLIETQDAEHRSPVLFRVLAVALILGLVGKYAVDTRVRAREIAHAGTFVREVTRLVPPDALVFQIDGTGFVGYFSDRGIVNGDGLVNTHAFLRRLRQNDLGGYLEETGTRHIIHSSYPSEGVLFSHHGLVVHLREVETLVSPPPGLARHTAFGLYRLIDHEP